MSFRGMVESDNQKVFMCVDEYADPRIIKYDGKTYREVPCVISKLKEKERVTNMRDHAQGLYLVSAILHCPSVNLDGIVPEKGGLISISDNDGFFCEYYVAQSGCDLGMIRLELEAYNE